MERSGGSETIDARDLRAAFAVLEDCEGAADVAAFRERAIEALARHYDVRSTTFFVGQTLHTACADPDPLVVGVTRGMLPEYQEYWHPYDVFASPEAMRAFDASRLAILDECRTLGPEQQEYATAYLQRHGILTAAALLLDLPGGRRALLGLFDRDAGRLSASQVASLRLMAPHLNRLAGTLEPDRTSDGRLERLTPRQLAVAELVAEGLSNGAIAEQLVLHEDSVKKYVSRIMAVTECRNRTEVALMVHLARALRGPDG
ncbi:MAG TPA: LuxR C-terminal-related transcriptional regulator [Nocardioides sp.]